MTTDTSSGAIPQPSTGPQPRSASAPAMRTDIQALRAVAVLGVVIYHLWPWRLTGGYAGVDVFFVISGYLITAHLIRDVTRSGRLSLAQFWARRARRLIPASMTVLAVIAIATFAITPEALWGQHFREIIASATYWENWRLAIDSVGYLTSENGESPVQHFWSLSVEEQFYLIWPVLVVVGIWAARSRLSLTRLVRVIALAVLAASLTASILLTITSPSSAYFVTHTRAWEFAAGALVAAAPSVMARIPASARATLEVLGWLAIGATFVLYGPATPFPGWTAVLPVVGTLAVLVAGTDHPTGSPLTRLGSLRPVQRIGDISYSLYLWHWPVLILGTFALGHDASTLELVVMLATSILLAELTYRWVETPTRRSRWLSARPQRGIALAVISAVAVSSIAVYGLHEVDRRAEQSEAEAARLAQALDGCFGAEAMLDTTGRCDDELLAAAPVVPSQAAVRDDVGIAFDCYDFEPAAEVLTCSFGSTAPSATRIALVGDSHAAMLVPGLAEHAADEGWRVDIYVSRRCTIDADTSKGDDCARHAQAVAATLQEADVDAVLVATRRAPDDADASWDGAAARMAAVLQPLVDRGVTVMGVSDNPLPTAQALACIEEGSESDLRGCAMTSDEGWRTADTVIDALAMVPGAHLIDTRDAYCRDDRCPVVIGSVLAYRDGNHISATFSHTLAPHLVDLVRAELAG